MSDRCKLSECPRQTEVCVKSFDLDPKLVLRLAEIGISVNCPLKVIENRKNGPMIVQSQNVQIALHRNITENMLVVTSGVV